MATDDKRAWFGKGDDYPIVEIGGLTFRDAKDGDMTPFNPHTEAPELLRWFCPSLSVGESISLAKRGAGMMPTVQGLRALILGNIEAVRAERSELPARVRRVAQQIAADATSGPIASAPERYRTGKLCDRPGCVDCVALRGRGPDIWVAVTDDGTPWGVGPTEALALDVAFDRIGAWCDAHLGEINSETSSLEAVRVERIESAEKAVPSPAEVAELLREVEWGGGAICGKRTCPVCGGVEPSQGEPFVARGHAPDCKLAAMLRRCEGA